MNVGIDYGNTLTYPKIQSLASTLLKDNKVFVVSAVKPHNVETTRLKIKELGIPFEGVIVIPFSDWLSVPMLKLEASRQLNIDLFIDDRLDTCAYLKMNGILTLYLM